MNEQLLKELIKTRSVLKQKCRTLKVGEAENEERLEKAFKPITEPLKTLVNNAKYDKSAIENSDTRSNSFNFHEMSTKVGTSSPKKIFNLKMMSMIAMMVMMIKVVVIQTV
ncbi:hypothetical protein CVS40_8599 [Lucilia cuprina]|nr:hypothetical protein CVS40_8599 [Lucilia cuprina]